MVSMQKRKKRGSWLDRNRECLAFTILWVLVALSTLNFVNQILYFWTDHSLYSYFDRWVIRYIEIAGVGESIGNFVSTNFVPRLWILRYGLTWTFQNRFLYACWCPEWVCPSLLWLRKPPVSNRVVYLTAKFGNRAGQFDDQVHRHVRNVQATGVFDSSNIVFYSTFPDWILRDRDWDEHLEFLDERQPVELGMGSTNKKRKTYKQETGAGYFFWKPALIEHHLSELNNGDFLVYGDIDRPPSSYTALLLETMAETKADLAVEQTTLKEWAFNKADSYLYFCHDRPGPSHDNSGQYSAGYIVLRKSPGTIKFVRQWVESAKNFHLLTSSTHNHPLKFPNAEYFFNHRRDQALFSSLLKCTYAEPEKLDFPFTCLGYNVAHTFRLEGVEPRPFWVNHLI